MKCQNCGENESNVKYTQIINGRKTELNLCSNCAEEMNLGTNFNFNFDFGFKDLFENMFGNFSNFGSMMQLPELVLCPANDVEADVFPDYNEILRKNKKQKELKKETKVSTVDSLRKEIEKCIKEENYERAAVLRDEIKKLENK